MPYTPEDNNPKSPEKHDKFWETPAPAEPVIPGDDMDIDHMLDVERRIRAGDPVSDAERETYEKVSADLRATLKSIRIPAQAFQLPESTREAFSALARVQQDVTKGIRQQVKDAFAANLGDLNFRVPAISTPKITFPAYPITVTPVGLQWPPSHLHRPVRSTEEDAEKGDELEVNSAAIEAAPVEEATALLALADHMDAQRALFEQGIELADKQLKEAERLNGIMDIVKAQSDEQGKFSKRMAWFMLAIGVGTVGIPAWQLVLMLNGA